MPTRSALDPSIRYDDADQEAAQARARNQDFMFRNYMQNQMQANDNGARERMLAAELADRSAGRQFQGQLARDVQGTFDARSRAERGIAELNDAGQTTRLGISMGPQQSDAALRARMYDDQSGVANARNSITARLLGDLEKSLGGGMGGAPGGAAPTSGAPTGGGPAGGGFQLDPKMRQGMMYGLLNMKDPQAETDALIRQVLLSKAGSTDAADLPALLEAVKSGDPSKMPAATGLNSQALGSYAQAQQAVAPDLQDMYAFLRQNNWSIGDSDQATIAQKFQAISQKLDSFRVPPAIKQNILNDLKQKMQQALRENGVMFEAAGSDAVRQKYGL